VFLDESFDDAWQPAETLIPGVVVTAYGPAGEVIASVVTGADGAYQFTVFAGDAVRIELTNLPAGLSPAPPGSPVGGTIRFVAAPRSRVDFGLRAPHLYCQADPMLVTNCFVQGDQQLAGDADVLVSFPYSAGSDSQDDPSLYDLPPHGVDATARQIGTTFGLAWQRSSGSVFAAAFMKRHTGFGPAGTGAVYRIDRASGTVETFLDLNALFGLGTAGVDPRTSANYFHDPLAWDAVGKLSLGDLDISEDDQTLWLVNLADRAVYRLPIGYPPVAPSIEQIDRYPVPLDQPDCPDPFVDIRPFGLGIQGRDVYVGVVCSAESSRRIQDLRAYVYRLEPGSGIFAQVLSLPLDYPRGCAGTAWQKDCGGKRARWLPWASEPLFRGPQETNPGPWLSDIVFDNGAMLLGFRDRFADQRGNFSGSTDVGDVRRYSAVSAGDILRACPDGAGGWKLESNATCGGTTTAGAGNGQGPGGGEYYFEEDFPKFGDPATIPRHDEILVGGLAVVPGAPHVLSTAFDPVPINGNDQLYDGGILWMNKATGRWSKSYRVFNGGPLDSSFGKANGLGDLEVMCDPAPIGIGDRVWHDLDGNGLQDAGEPPIAGVRLLLVQGGQVLAETRTDREGRYAFGRHNVPSGIGLLTSYVVRVDPQSPVLSGAALTLPKQGSSDSLDSDGVMVGGYPQAELTTGLGGEGLEHIDFGFVGDFGPPAQVGPTSEGRRVELWLSALTTMLLLAWRKRRSLRLGRAARH
jgi:hypothetical protein